MKPTIRVLLVDDHVAVRAGYRLLLAQSPDIEVVGEADCGEEACSQYWDRKPDVIVMDLTLPGIGGLASIRRICCQDPRARLLVFSMHDEMVYIARALEAGAKGYVTKSCAPDTLLQAIYKIASGGTYVEPHIAQRMVAQAITRSGNSPLDSLSPREFDVFCLLARGLTAHEVAERMRLSYKTVSNYSTSIKSKLDIHTGAEMARIAYQHGLVDDAATFGPPASP
ncbi:response regulator [Methylogaea oryzae]|uniref:DNA-binding response regulator n=1 Tax=Methylogaea oryzae TaxID=1295382 RepID=A0A8D4VQY6_9GAMM|nr:response regulator transcription factor [Methylogaea oryzae]BBL72485.1 DNA-binding response regulator [Methylogaea oryzae]